MARLVKSWTDEFLNSLIGTKIGNCTILSILPLFNGKKRFLARCECGKEWPIYVYRAVRNQGTLCMRCTRKKAYVGAGGRKRMAHHPEYKVWRGMVARCHIKNNAGFYKYGARGIVVCDRWRGVHGFENFLADVGPRPSPDHSIERIDNNGNYEPDNCRWATTLEQNRNSRHNRLITFQGKTQCLTAWAEELHFKTSAFYNLFYATGLDDDELLGVLSREIKHT